MTGAGNKKAAAEPGDVAETPAEKRAVGWREWVALPQIGVQRIKAKLDTGARSSALHAFNVKPKQEQGRWFVTFDVHPLQRNDSVIKTCYAEAVDYRWVTNSGGGREKRFVIVTDLMINGGTWPIEVTLTDRDQMGFRMLIGRTAMQGRLTVDPDLSFCLGVPERARRKKAARVRKEGRKKTDPPTKKVEEE